MSRRYVCYVLLTGLTGCGGENTPAGSPDAGAIDAAQAAFVTTDKGEVIGTTGTVRKYLGIPYAAPPVGELRWKPPQPHDEWDTPLDATQYANHCAQSENYYARATEAEDCLHVNIYAPAQGCTPEQPCAVMVWIPGGGFLIGESEKTDPSKMVAEGNVIVVTHDHRIGALGFLAHPALSAESPDHVSGNYGLLDQQAALGWVQRNINAFGGDPSRVTIFGTSAGGWSVHIHMASPLSEGLFSQAIAMSGGLLIERPLADAEADGMTFAASAGCPDQTAACLRSLPVADILAHQAGGGRQPTGPVVDDHVLTQTVPQALAAGQLRRVPLMQGSTRHEYRQLVAEQFDLRDGPLTPAAYESEIQAYLRVPAGLVPPVVAQYPLADYPSPDEALATLMTDVGFACMDRIMGHMLSPQMPVFIYEFADTSAPQLYLPEVSFQYLASHTKDHPYLFDVVPFIPAPPLNAEQEQLSDAMVGYLTSFARTGQPTWEGTEWPAYDGALEEVMSLVPPTPLVVTDVAADHKCTFWDPLVRAAYGLPPN